MKKPSTNPDVAAKPKEESFFAKERRLRTRRQTFKMSYNKGLYFENKKELIKWLEQDEILVRIHSGGKMNDGTEFLQITIEGIKPE